VKGRRLLTIVALVATGASSAYAGSRSSWDGTWSGMLNKTEPVSVTIAGGKVVGYTIRGFAPLGIEAASVTGNRVSLLIGADYHVSLTKRSERAALGMARGPLGSGTASLIRQ
jgi:hypothetical protein